MIEQTNVQGIIKEVFNPWNQITKTIYECSACGKIVTIQQIKKSLQQPEPCNCNKIARFNLIGKEKESLQAFHIKMDDKLVKIILRKEELQREFNKIIGVEIIARGKFNTEGEFEADYIEYLEKDRFVNFDKIDLEKIEEISRDKDVIKKLSESLFPQLYEEDKIREAALLQIVASKEEGKHINIFIIGDLGTAKTTIVKRLENIFPENLSFSLRNYKDKTIAGKIFQDRVEGLLISLAKGKIVYIDDTEKIGEEVKREIENAIEENKVKIGESKDVEIDVDVSIFAVCNKQELEYIKSKQLTEEFLTKFDLVFRIKDNTDLEKDQKIASTLLGEGSTSSSIIDSESAKKYLMHAMHLKAPLLTEETKRRIKDSYTRLRDNTQVYNTTVQINSRHITSLYKLARAYARIRLSKEVTKEDIRKAENLLADLYIMPFYKSPNDRELKSLLIREHEVHKSLKTFKRTTLHG